MKKILSLLAILFLIISIFFIGDVYFVISKGPSTEYGHLLLKDRNGKIITDKGRSGGYSLPYTGDIHSEIVKNIISIEDARFYEHSGINIEAKMASLYQNIQAGGIVRGGSTITEQYVKNAFYNQAPRNTFQKLREAIGAIIIENRFTKDEILQKYLGAVYMGNGQYGIETYAHGKNDTDTVLDIITKIKYPNITDSNSGTVLDYRNIVSEKIGKKGTKTNLFETKKRKQINQFSILTNRVDQEISLYCKNQKNTLKQWTKDIPKNLCISNEMNLTLTVDSNLIDTIEGISRGVLKSLEGKNVTNANIYIKDPKTDTILAYIGNSNPGEEIDMITRPRSVGSLLKPFIYLIALKSGADSEDYIIDDKIPYETEIDGKYYIPENYNPKSYGPIRLREALGNSLNAATVKLTDTIGISNIYDELRNFGLSLNHDVGYYGYGISLGTVEVSMENIINTYGTLLKTNDPDTWQIAQILKDPRNRAKTFGISSILNTSIPMSVKTGTSTDFRDNWAVSYSSDAIIGVWVGNSDGSSMGDVSGVSGAGPIWHQIAEYMIERGMIKNKKLTPPTSLHQIPICLDTNCLRKELLFTKKSESPKSRSSEGIYYRSDFFGTISQEEMAKWNIQN
ncbi:hypothetical protein HOO68_03485 [Candidatus Gracilibacteria bacterium]|nr:hypothetical protein [Candidatus Gracilibacteria bacterium]